MKPTFVCLFLLCGCYTYRNTSVADIRVATPTRVELTENGTTAIAAQVGPRGKTLEGVVTGKTDSSLVVGVRSLTRTDGLDELWKGEHIGVPSSFIARIQTRKFSALRTGLLVVGMAGGALLVQGASDGNVFGPGRGGSPGGSQ
ncbi:MAG TPA: hypothetical protein VNO75_07165 [Gemmatimonadaceae bacterium]|nr:hypothetical protein [Gemmatimonadaceae bacterium]